MALDLTGVTGGVVDLKGAVHQSPVLKGIHGDPANPIFLTNGTLIAAQIIDCSHLALDGLTLLGDAGDTPVPQLTSKALLVRGSHHIRVVRADVSRAMVGAAFLNCQDILVDAGDFHDQRRDGLHLVNCERPTVRRTMFRDWQPAKGDHCDGVQAWNDGLPGPAADHVIEDNCIRRGATAAAVAVPQGIFYRWYDPKDPRFAAFTSFTNLLIRYNLVIGANFNGIVAAGDGVILANEVVSFADKMSKIVTLSDRFTVDLNAAQRFSIDNQFNASAPAGNRINDPVGPAEEAALVAAWRERVFGATPAPEPTPAPTPAPTPTPAPDPEPAPEPEPEPAPTPTPAPEPVADLAALLGPDLMAALDARYVRRDGQ